MLESTGVLFEDVASQLTEFVKAIGDNVTAKIIAGPKPALSDSTIRRKRRAGVKNPEHTWIETGTLIDNLWEDPFIILEKKKVTVGMVVNRKVHPFSPDVTMNDVFRFLEYGTKTQPARPVLRPAIAEAKAVKVPFFEEEIAKAFRIRLFSHA